ncbi:MAG: alpha/beta hydrolase [Magnetococcales bacterium]|nr:alpha/beta hydrolase [Magnetococcales bacterium]
MEQPTLIDHPQIRSILFHPRGEEGYSLAPGARELRFPVDTNVTLGARLYPTTSPQAPLLLYWHGNGEIAADYDDISQLYTGMGIHFLVVDFRGYGISTGTPSGTALLRDAVTVVDLIPTIVQPHLPPFNRLLVMGRSMGSAATIEIAWQRAQKIHGIILESPFAYTIALIERLGGFSLNSTPESVGFNSLEKIRSIALPLLLIHGQADDLIPISDSQALYDASASDKKRFVRIPQAGHNDLMLQGMGVYFQAIGQFVAGISTP